MIAQRDYDLLLYFLKREAKQFNFVTDATFSAEDKRENYAEKLFGEIVSIEEKSEYIEVQSLSNMGFVESSLLLTNSDNLVLNGSRIVVLMPLTPRGRCSYTLKEKGNG